MDKYDVAIIGGGASGLAAAIEIGMKAPDLSVVVLEKIDGLGRKIRATGSGRCNITNTAADGYIEIMEFFSRIGLMTKAYDNGLVYPYSESAADVAELLTTKTYELGATVLDNATVTAVEPADESGEPKQTDTLSKRKFEADIKKDIDRVSAYNIAEQKHNICGYIISYEKKGTKMSSKLMADKVILALGGKAGPTYGTTGDGYAIARSLGHSTVAPIPVLTSVECAEWSDGAIALAGTRTRCRASLYEDGTEEFAEKSLKFREDGELQLTKFGISGICVFNMTRHMRYNRAAGERLSRFLVRVNLFPDGDIRDYLRARCVGAFSGEKVDTLLCTVLKKNVAKYVLEDADRRRFNKEQGHGGQHSDGAKRGGRMPLSDRTIASLTDADVELIAESVHALEFHPTGVSGWREAQATAGGVRLEEINAETYESLICPGLYITGELLDYDGPCGGFNLSNAWISGLHAAADIAVGGEQNST